MNMQETFPTEASQLPSSTTLASWEEALRLSVGLTLHSRIWYCIWGQSKREREKVKTYLMGSGDDSRSLLLSVFLGRPWGSEGLRGDRNATEAFDDFLDIGTGRSLPA